MTDDVRWCRSSPAHGAPSFVIEAFCTVPTVCAKAPHVHETDFCWTCAVEVERALSVAGGTKVEPGKVSRVGEWSMRPA